jgi:glycosyltransferase involved in cell wall biosynthesis
MRILFCSQAAHRGGGAETWLEALSESLLVRGWEVVTALAKGRFHDPERYVQRHQVLEPVTIDGTSGLREDRILALWSLFDRVRPDVIFPVHLADAIDAAAAWKQKHSDARLVVCVHGQGEDRLEQIRRRADFIDLAASVSRRTSLRMEPLLGASRVRHIPTGVPSPNRGVAPREQLRTLSYVGRLDAEKRIRDVIPLIRALPEVVFQIVGTGAEEGALRDALRAEISSGHVVFHGDVPRQELYSSIYPASDALILFSEAETGPIVAWEAMAHGVVPIVSDYLGRSEENVIRHGETGLVFPVGDVESAAELIKTVTGEGQLRQLSIRARNELPKEYKQEAFGDAWHQALTDCLRAPQHAGHRRALPPLVSPGFVGSLGLSPRLTSRLRRIIGRRFHHDDPGSEWPH